MSSYGPGPPRRLGPISSFHGSDSWRPDGERHPHQFSFRNSSAAPQYPREHDHYEPSRKPPRSRQNDEHVRNQRGLGSDQRNENGGSFRARPSQRPHTGFQRGRGNRHVATAARPLLSLKQADTVEQTLGVADDPNATKRFLHVDDMTDSEEEQMEESDSDQDTSNEPASRPTEMGTAQQSLEPPVKRRALGIASNETTAVSQVPKWSNPDPYTSLPPVDELRKRKDVVKIIRKARIAVERDATVANQAGINEDFISFGFEETIASKESAPPSSSIIAEDQDEGELTVASSEPKRFSHLQNLHSEHFAKAPGTEDVAVSTDIKGSPPGLESRPLPGAGIAMSETSHLDQDNPLGSRKRTHDDVIKNPPERMARGKKTFLGTSGGFVLDAWLSDVHSYPTPWLDTSAGRCENMGFRLHKEICDFYDFVRPKKYEQELREDLLDRLQAIIANQFHRCKVYCFGSFAAGIYLPNADMDVVIISESFRVSGIKAACQNSGAMHRFGAYLRRSGVAEADSVEVITSAKVPLIKFVDHITGIRVDMSFENQTGLTANDTFNAWKSQYPAMPIIVTLIKQFLLMRGLNEVVNGGLGGFSVTCLVTSLLQNLPRIQSGELIPEQHLGEILIEFLDLYGNRLDTTRTGITMNPPGYFDKYSKTGRSRGNRDGRQVYQANKSDRLAIMDPNDPDNDISGGSRNVMLIFDRFSQAHLELMKAMKSPTRLSLLDWMLGGEYAIFRYQRSHLQKLYRHTRGAPEQAVIDFRIQVPPPLHNEETTIEMLKNPERHADWGHVPNQRTISYFINPLSEDAEIAAQRLPIKKKKLKAKKLKKKASLPKSDFRPDSNVKPTPVPPKKIRPKDPASNPKRIGKNTRAKTRATEIKCELPDCLDPDLSSLTKAAGQLINMAASSVKHNPAGNDNVKRKAQRKVEKKRWARQEKGNAMGITRNQSLLPQDSATKGNGMTEYVEGTCRSNPISIG